MRILRAQLVAEFLGTFALVFVGAGATVIAVNQFAGTPGLVGVALATGLVLAVMVSSLGHVSGAHFNPAVTLAVWVTGKIESARASLYIVAQLAGAVAGAWLLRWMLPVDVWQPANLGAVSLATGIGINVGKGVLIEASLTFLLTFAIFAAAVDKRGPWKELAGLTIGLVLVFGILVGGPLTGAAMNPARAFGPAVAAGQWTNFWVYVVGPVTGSVVAAVLYWSAFLRGSEEPPVEPEPEAEAEL